MKILIIRLSSIGDVLLTTPVVRCLKRQLDDVEIHFLTRDSNRQLLSSNPNIDKLPRLDKKISKTIARLRSEHYDYVIDLHNIRTTARIRLALSSPKLVYKKENIHKFLTVITKRDFMSGRHVVDRYMDAVRPLGVTPDSQGLDLYLPEELKDSNLYKVDLDGVNVGELTSQPYVVIVCGAQHLTKCMPADKIHLLASYLSCRVVLLGDGDDRKRLRNFAIPFKSNVVNLCGKTSLLMSAAIISHASVVITPDTGMMHFAAAFHRKIIAVWGATTPSFGFSAYNSEHADCVVDNLWCNPCSRMGTGRCPLGHFKCMKNQGWQQIAESAQRICMEK